MADRAKLVSELEALDAALKAVGFRMQLAAARRQFLGHPAQDEEARLLNEMDRIMTRLRSIEAKLSLVDRGEMLPIE